MTDLSAEEKEAMEQAWANEQVFGISPGPKVAFGAGWLAHREYASADNELPGPDEVLGAIYRAIRGTYSDDDLRVLAEAITRRKVEPDA